MPDRKKSTNKRTADRAPRRAAAKELSAEQLENVAGGLLPAAVIDTFKIGEIKGEYANLSIRKK